MKYEKKILLEGEAFDKQVLKRKKFGLKPDLRNLKKNLNFYNNPWREPQFFNIQWMKIINDVIKACSRNNRKKKILEVGCGTGFLSLELARKGHNVLGVDISNISIDEANKYLKKKKNENLKLSYKVGDINNIKFREKFDVLIFYRSLHHFKNISNLLKKLSKNLNPKSTIIICEPLRKNFEKINSIISLILRLSLSTWIPIEKKIPKKINYNFFVKQQKKIQMEYKYLSKKNRFKQSPMDNSTDDPQKVLLNVKKYFKIKKLRFYDAFIDKLIGGLRGKQRFLIAKLLKEFDNYLIKENIAKGTTLYIEAEKK